MLNRPLIHPPIETQGTSFEAKNFEMYLGIPKKQSTLDVAAGIIVDFEDEREDEHEDEDEWDDERDDEREDERGGGRVGQIEPRVPPLPLPLPLPRP